jgi:hypothetical protein
MTSILGGLFLLSQRLSSGRICMFFITVAYPIFSNSCLSYTSDSIWHTTHRSLTPDS